MFTASTDAQGRYGVSVRSRAHASTVVFCEGGLVAPVEAWMPLMERLAPDVDSVATERAGTFRSAHPRGDRGLPRLAEETAASIADRVAGCRVVMVAEGFGGLIALECAGRHPELIDALVLVDSLHPAALARSARQRQAMARLESSMARSAVRARLGGDRGNRFPRLSPEQDEKASVALRVAPWTHRTALRELQRWKRGRARPLPPALGALPLSVVSSEVLYRGDPSQSPLQDDLATLSEASSTALIPGSSALTDPAALGSLAHLVARQVRALEGSVSVDGAAS